MEQNTQQVENFFGSAYATGKDHDAVAQSYKGFQAFLDVGHHHQFVDQRVGGFGGDNAGLGDTDVAPIGHALLGVRQVGSFHRPFHGTRTAAGADIQLAQA